MQEKQISFENWEKFVLPVLQEKTVPSIILYKDTRRYDGMIRLETQINGFYLYTTVAWEKIVKHYQGKEDEISLEGPPPEISPEDMLNKFNQDYMDGRGIPEL